ncbi:hypothetical protein CIB48_g9770 [Xylaria polymorpha]|nr:hypothetical protein CIB48_g9770 [Xylaria polymorpha]
MTGTAANHDYGYPAGWIASMVNGNTRNGTRLPAPQGSKRVGDEWMAFAFIRAVSPGFTESVRVVIQVLTYRGKL